MYSHSFKEEFGNVLYCDTLFVGHQYSYFRKPFHDDKYIVISMLGRREAIYIVHGDGFLGLLGRRRRSIKAFILDGWLVDGTISVRYDVFPTSCQIFGQ